MKKPIKLLSLEETMEQVRILRLDPKRRTNASKHPTLERFAMQSPGEFPPLYPPVTEAALAEDETRLGFRLPSFLRDLYLKVGNGGFGPAYGLWGLKGGFPTWDPFAPEGSNIVDGYLAFLEWAREAGAEAPEKLIAICDWGGNNGSAVDCSTPEGEMVHMRDAEYIREGISFQDWMRDWASGVDLWKRMQKL